jgi:hypothetical protein
MDSQNVQTVVEQYFLSLQDRRNGHMITAKYTDLQEASRADIEQDAGCWFAGFTAGIKLLDSSRAAAARKRFGDDYETVCGGRHRGLNDPPAPGPGGVREPAWRSIFGVSSPQADQESQSGRKGLASPPLPPSCGGMKTREAKAIVSETRGSIRCHQDSGYHLQLGVDHFPERNTFLPLLRSSHSARDRGNLTGKLLSEAEATETTTTAANDDDDRLDNRSDGKTLLPCLLACD